MSDALHIQAYAGLFPEQDQMQVDTGSLARFEDPRSLRRTSHFCRLGLLAAHLCLATAPCRDGNPPGLVICTGFGPVTTSFDYSDSFEAAGPDLASPTAFSTSVYNIAASTISMRLGLSGPVHTLSQGETSFIAGLHTAFAWLREKRVSQVLLGVVDEYNQTLAEMMGEVPGIPRTPPQEGALFLLLSSEGGTHGQLHDWQMGLTPSTCCTESLDCSAFSSHPAGPVRALVLALQAQETSTVCESHSPDGWWSRVTLARR